MGAGAERLPGVDHDLADSGRVGCARRLPRRAHVQGGSGLPPGDGLRRRLDQHGPMELLPALLPVVGDLAGGDLDERVARDGVQVGQLRQLTRRSVDRVLDRPLLAAHLLHAGGRELQELGQHQLGLRAGRRGRRA